MQCAGPLLGRDIADADGEILEEDGIGITLDSKVQRLEKMGDGHEDRRRRNRGAGKSYPSCCREITPTRLKETGVVLGLGEFVTVNERLEMNLDGYLALR